MQSFPKGSKFYFGSSAGVAIKESISKAQKSIKIISPYISSDKIDLLAKKADENVKVILITQYDEDKYKQDKYSALNNVIQSTVEQKRTYANETTDTHIEKIIIERKQLPDNVELRNSLLKQRWLQLLWVVVGIVISIAIIKFPLTISDDKLQTVTFMKYVVAGLVMICFISVVISNIYDKMRSAFKIPTTEDVETAINIPSCTKTVTCSYDYVNKPNLTVKFANKGVSDAYNSILHCKLYIIDDSVAYIGSMNFTNSGFSNNFELRAKFVDKEDLINLTSAFQTILSQIECVDISSKYPVVFGELSNIAFNSNNVQKDLQ